MSEVFSSSVLEAINRATTYSSEYVDPSTLKVIVIDGETRNMTIPEGENLFGARGDKNVERKYFQCPKIVGDNIDLSQHLIYVNYVFTDIDSPTNLPETKIGMYHCEDVAVEGDNITFSWLLSGNVLHNPGFIAFKVCAKEKESDPTTVFNTTPAIGIVLYTIPDGSEIIPEEYPDIITQLLADMDATKEEVAAQIAKIDAIKDQIEGAVEGTLINDNTESNIFTYSSQKINTELRKKATYYNSVASMKADSSLKEGMVAITLGYYEANDGGGSVYMIQSSDGLENNITKYSIENGLMAKIIIEPIMFIECFGASVDNEDNSEIIKFVLEMEEIFSVKFTKGIYKCKNKMEISVNISSFFEKSKLLYTGEADIDTFITILRGEVEQFLDFNIYNTELVVDSNKKADVGVDANPHQRLSHISIFSFNAKKKGIIIRGGPHIYDLLYAANDSLIETDIENETIGLHVISSDNFIGDVIVVNYKTGVKTSGALNKFNTIHPWSSCKVELRKDLVCLECATDKLTIVDFLYVDAISIAVFLSGTGGAAIDNMYCIETSAAKVTIVKSNLKNPPTVDLKRFETTNNKSRTNILLYDAPNVTGNNGFLLNLHNDGQTFTVSNDIYDVADLPSGNYDFLEYNGTDIPSAVGEGLSVIVKMLFQKKLIIAFSIPTRRCYIGIVTFSNKSFNKIQIDK